VRSHKWNRLLVAAVTLSMLTAAFSSGTAGASGSGSKTPYSVFSVLGLSGALAPTSQAELQGIKAGAQVLNRSGGILGHHIVVSAVDDQDNPSLAASLLQEKISASKPNFVFAGTTSGETVSLLPILTRAGIVSDQLPSSTEIDMPSKYPDAFGLSDTSSSQAESTVADMIAKFHPKKVGILLSTDTLGQTFVPVYESLLTKAGVPWVLQQFADTDLSMVPEIQSLKSAGVDLVFVSSFGAPIGYILKSIAELAWNVNVFGDQATSANNLAALVPASDLTHVRIIVESPLLASVPKSPSMKAMLSQLKKDGVTLNQPIDIYAEAYDCMQLLALAAKQSGTINTAGMVKAIQHLKIPHPSPFTWPGEGHYTPQQHSLVSYAAEWSIVPAGPIVNGFISG
jgi:branched-chain amino acid transport system substrate-binding protein